MSLPALIASISSIVWLGAGWATGAEAFDRPTLQALHAELRGRLDQAFPGRGIIDYPPYTAEDVPKGYAMILKAEIIASLGGQVTALARTAGAFLLAHSDERGDGFPGWGVPAAWDAYGDGSINPRHTKYTISTAIVADALLDWIEADPAAPRARVLELVRGSIQPYLRDDVLAPSGLLPYSLEAVDRRYDTFNPAAYMAGLIQRYSMYETDSALQSRMRAVADKTVAAHLAHRLMSPSGAWYWGYSVSEPHPNDLAHAGYVILGLSRYALYGGALAARLDLGAIERHLADFVDPDGKLEAWPHFRKEFNRAPRSYDIGMGLHLVCRSSMPRLREPYISAIPSYRDGDGAYRKFPIVPNEINLAVREYEGYMLLGMATCLSSPP